MIECIQKPDSDCHAKVKIISDDNSFGSETFWVRGCQDNGEGEYVGLVDNDLMMTEHHGYDYDNVIKFKV